MSRAEQSAVTILLLEAEATDEQIQAIIDALKRARRQS